MYIIAPSVLKGRGNRLAPPGLRAGRASLKPAKAVIELPGSLPFPGITKFYVSPPVAPASFSGATAPCRFFRLLLHPSLVFNPLCTSPHSSVYRFVRNVYETSSLFHACWCPVPPPPCREKYILYFETQTSEQQEPSNNWPALAGRPVRPGDRYAVPGRAYRSTHWQLV